MSDPYKTNWGRQPHGPNKRRFWMVLSWVFIVVFVALCLVLGSAWH